MTTTNSDGNFEHLAGVPSAAELTILANQLFPDLTEGVNATETGAEVADVRETEQAAYAASAETGVGALPSGVPSFNWDDPFAYGHGVPGVSGVSLVPGISGNRGREEAVSYA
ncbi:MAG: hypothetical protein J6P70_06285, partial [Ruminobacter sp.]|nr:hypothetical protein [Ruminobacter sp.]